MKINIRRGGEGNAGVRRCPDCGGVDIMRLSDYLEFYDITLTEEGEREVKGCKYACTDCGEVFA